MPHSYLQGSKLSKRLQKELNLLKNPRRRSLLLIFGGFVLLLFGGVNYYKIRILSFSQVPVAESVKLGQVPTQVTIPSIKLDLPIETGKIVEGVWQISETSATFLESSAPPKTGGNIVVYGHNKKAIFGSLPYIEVGNEIYIKTTEGQIHIYEVYKKEIVNPTRVDLVSPTGFEELTIYTCWGLFDQKRVVIKAKPLS